MQSSLLSIPLVPRPSYAQYLPQRPILENSHRGNITRDNMNSVDTETGPFPNILATAIRKDLLYAANIS